MTSPTFNDHQRMRINKYKIIYLSVRTPYINHSSFFYIIIGAAKMYVVIYVYIYLYENSWSYNKIKIKRKKKKRRKERLQHIPNHRNFYVKLENNLSD